MTLDELKQQAFKSSEVKREYDRLKAMTLDQARQLERITWEQVARDLSMKCKEYGEAPLYAHRLWRLRTGKSEPKSYELRALWECYSVDSFRE